MVEKTKESIIEREYIIPLRHRWRIVPTYKRANKAIKSIKEFLVRHMKIRDKDLDKIKIDKTLNEVIWSRGIKHPPAKIKVKAIKEGDLVKVEAIEMSDKLKFKKIREEKLQAKGKETAKKKKVVEEEKKEETNNQEAAEKKTEQIENKAAVIEAGAKMEKAEAKKEKHNSSVKSPKEEKNSKTGYNQQSRGH